LKGEKNEGIRSAPFITPQIAQHFFFFTKHFLSKERTCAKKEYVSFGKAFLPKKRFVLKEKQICSFGKAFLSLSMGSKFIDR